MRNIKIGIVGAGKIGTNHIGKFVGGHINGGVLKAICDVNPDRIDFVKNLIEEGKYENREEIEYFDDYDKMLEKAEIDAVIVAVPHYDHPKMAMQGLQAGIHTLVEKPAGVYTKQVREMNEFAKSHKDKVFAIMYNQRTNPVYKKAKELFETGELGELRRFSWIMTTWYRPQGYYNSGGWRATWKGEGGGVLLNQDPHQLDLWQWMIGMPKTMRAFCKFGSQRNIPVDDDVTAYFEYDNGATGTFITGIFETPGTNRMEISGSKGQIVIETKRLESGRADSTFRFTKLKTDESEYNKLTETDASLVWTPIENEVTYFCKDELAKEYGYGEMDHVNIINNFIKAIKGEEDLISPAVEGINGLTISNAMHLSSWTDETITLSELDEDKFYDELQKRIKEERNR